MSLSIPNLASARLPTCCQCQPLQDTLLSRHDTWPCTAASQFQARLHRGQGAYPGNHSAPGGSALAELDKKGRRGHGWIQVKLKLDLTYPLSDSKNIYSHCRGSSAIEVEVGKHRGLNQLELQHYIFTKIYNPVIYIASPPPLIPTPALKGVRANEGPEVPTALAPREIRFRFLWVPVSRGSVSSSVLACPPVLHTLPWLTSSLRRKLGIHCYRDFIRSLFS